MKKNHPMSAAERQKTARDRRRRGVRIAQIEIPDSFSDFAIATGLVSEKETDLAAYDRALEKLVAAMSLSVTRDSIPSRIARMFRETESQEPER